MAPLYNPPIYKIIVFLVDHFLTDTFHTQILTNPDGKWSNRQVQERKFTLQLPYLRRQRLGQLPGELQPCHDEKRGLP